MFLTCYKRLLGLTVNLKLFQVVKAEQLTTLIYEECMFAVAINIKVKRELGANTISIRKIYHHVIYNPLKIITHNKAEILNPFVVAKFTSLIFTLLFCDGVLSNLDTR